MTDGQPSRPAGEPGLGIPDSPTPVPLLNVANLLTLSRFMLVPVFLAALFVPDVNAVGWRLVAAAIFAVASVTDHVDGRLARGRGLVTDFGKIADPIADKALTGSAMVGLSLLGELPWWVTVVIAVREIGVTLLRFWVIRHGVIPASRGGKAKTLAQLLAIGLFLLPLPAGVDPVCWVVLYIALALTVLTGADYVVRALRLRARGRRAVAGAR
ncbi:MAG: CDP-diacylglycerol--glycerol-3-phosphate 3-phosphatidyltransferase [Sciscionella sp.]